MTNDQITGLLYTLLSAVEETRMVIDKLVEKGVLTKAERKEIAQSYAKMVDARRTAIQQEDDQEPTTPEPSARRRALPFRS
jgi:polyhydroxyalkanoate synthesis regulator phasin